MREPRPINYSSSVCGVPSLGPGAGANFEQNKVPVLGEFSVQGVSQASQAQYTCADEAVRCQVTGGRS